MMTLELLQKQNRELGATKVKLNLFRWLHGQQHVGTFTPEQTQLLCHAIEDAARVD